MAGRSPGRRGGSALCRHCAPAPSPHCREWWRAGAGAPAHVPRRQRDGPGRGRKRGSERAPRAKGAHDPAAAPRSPCAPPAGTSTRKDPHPRKAVETWAVLSES
ncbi:unnamed protein product [Nyctereutes procyonoides]|uniref:(raccoon dog) hypothetical protein n=1 Tax=Nyctereutes procyonoides TaxID=34880 RepID=A0A811Z2K5_NYCPR|nr:unnamed protein product [Nyctereutes procyonoides]CAD7682893.1 unnamed protein product [Nyctereutes procyonoides]